MALTFCRTANHLGYVHIWLTTSNLGLRSCAYALNWRASLIDFNGVKSTGQSLQKGTCTFLCHVKLFQALIAFIAKGSTPSLSCLALCHLE